MDRVIAYIDGFNLYFGLKSKGWRRYYWLNPRALVMNLVKPGQRLVSTKYFTARITSPANDPGKQRRQNAILEAIGTLPDTRIVCGHYLPKVQTYWFRTWGCGPPLRAGKPMEDQPPAIFCRSSRQM